MYDRLTVFDRIVICVGLAFLTTLIIHVATLPRREPDDDDDDDQGDSAR